jgi:lipopolysaccharide transport system permease protein
MGMLSSVWAYRGFVWGSVKREFQSKYQNSVLGAAWTLINPLAMIVVYTVVFSQVMRAKLPGVDHGFAYGVYLCSGLLTWGLFAEVVGRCQQVFIDNASLLKKVNFPRLTLPLIVVSSALVNFAIIFGLFLVFLLVSGLWPGWVSWAALAVLAVQVLFSVGLGLVLGVLNVFFRDVGQFFAIALQFWFWFTPIVYPVSILPQALHGVMSLNPMFSLTSAYQAIFVHARAPDFEALLYPLILGLLLGAFALHLYRKHGGEMVDEL